MNWKEKKTEADTWQLSTKEDEVVASWCPVCHQSVKGVMYEHICDLPDFIHSDCSQCGDEEVLLQKSEQEDELLHYVCKECFLRGL